MTWEQSVVSAREKERHSPFGTCCHCGTITTLGSVCRRCDDALADLEKKMTDSTQRTVAVFANALADILLVVGDSSVDNAQARRDVKQIVLKAARGTELVGLETLLAAGMGERSAS